MLRHLLPPTAFEDARRLQAPRRNCAQIAGWLAVLLLLLPAATTRSLARATQLRLLQANTTSLSFGNLGSGAKATQQFTLTNTGSVGLKISQFTLTGTGFTMSVPPLPINLSSGQSVSVTVTFAPTTAGSYSGSFTVASNANNLPPVVALSGTCVSLQLSASTASLAFGNVAVGSTSTQAISFTNIGTGAVTISQTSVTGTGFSLTGLLLPLTLSPSQSVSAAVAFAPNTAGSLTGSISVASNASNSPATVALSGTGTTLQLSASPSNLGFGNVTVGTSSVLPVVVANTGNQSVTISQITMTGAGFSASGPTFPATLAPGQNVTVSVTFDPTSAGSVTGSLSVISNATNSPAVAALAGTGANAHSGTVSWVASTSTGVTGYNVYRGTESGGPYTKINSSAIAGTTYKDTTIQAGQSYYYVVTSLDAAGDESVYSNSAEGVVPSP